MQAGNWVLVFFALAMRIAAQQIPAPSTTPAANVGDLKPLLSGASYPLTLKLGALNDEWRRFTAGGQMDMGGYGQILGAMFGGGANGAYYTRGETVTVGSETYIVAYRVQARPIDMATLMGRGAQPPKPEKLTPETILRLALVNLRTAGSLTDVAAFDLKREIADNAPPAEGPQEGPGEAPDAAPGTATAAAPDTTVGQSNLRQLGLAMLMYAQDYDETLPPMKTPAAFQKAVMPYIKNARVFTDPTTGEPYRPNPTLSGHKLAHIAAPAQMVALYEPRPAPDGKRSVCFVDNHVSRVPESSWPRLKRACKIP